MKDTLPIIADVPTPAPGLGFQEYAQAIADAAMGGSPPQFTIGIYGSWGSGKSSLLYAIERLLRARGDEAIPILFDAWRYEQSGPIIVPLVHRIYTVVKEEGNEQIVKHLKRALAAIVYSATFKLGPLGLQFDSSRLREAADDSDLTPLDTAFAKPFDEFRKIPASLKGRRIVVLVDDLDRCSPDNVIAVLESINLVMDVPGFVFVLALDYDVLVRAVELKYPQATSGHLFIEKMVQAPFRMPRLDLEAETSLEELIPGWIEMAPTLPTDFTNCARDIAMSALQANPRQIKRFVNSFLVVHRIIQQRYSYLIDIGISIDYQLLAALIAMQLRWPVDFIAVSEAHFSGAAKPLGNLTAPENEPQRRSFYDKYFSRDVPESMLDVLLQFTEAVVAPAAEPPVSGNASSIRELKRAEFIEQLQQRGFERSPRSPRLYYNQQLPNLRFAIEKTVIRREERTGESWSMVESYLITRETTKALAELDFKR